MKYPFGKIIFFFYIKYAYCKYHIEYASLSHLFFSLSFLSPYFILFPSTFSLHFFCSRSQNLKKKKNASQYQFATHKDTNYVYVHKWNILKNWTKRNITEVHFMNIHLLFYIYTVNLNERTLNYLCFFSSFFLVLFYCYFLLFIFYLKHCITVLGTITCVISNVSRKFIASKQVIELVLCKRIVNMNKCSSVYAIATYFSLPYSHLTFIVFCLCVTNEAHHHCIVMSHES